MNYERQSSACFAAQYRVQLCREPCQHGHRSLLVEARAPAMLPLSMVVLRSMVPNTLSMAAAACVMSGKDICAWAIPRAASNIAKSTCEFQAI